MKVFISGSISIKKLPNIAKKKIDSIIEKKLTVVIGDARGVDSIVQKNLLKENYNNVIVYHTGDKIRNNFGDWNTVTVQNENNLKGREFYTLKDLKMADDADYGLMIWDGKSKGTLKNIEEMKKNNKKFLVILNELVVDEKHFDQFIELKTNQEENSQLELF